MATHSSTLAWKIPCVEEPGRLQSMGSLRVGHNWTTSLSLFTFMHWRRKWQPTPVFLPGESQGRGSLVGCRLWGRTVRHDWSDLAAAAPILRLSPLLPTQLWFLLCIFCCRNIFWSVLVFPHWYLVCKLYNFGMPLRGGVLRVFLVQHLGNSWTIIS